MIGTTFLNAVNTDGCRPVVERVQDPALAV
jgi:hypothetical protein